MKEIRLKPFNIQTQVTQENALLFVSRKSEYTNSIIRDILYHFQDIPTGLIVSSDNETRRLGTKFVSTRKYNETTVKNLPNISFIVLQSSDGSLDKQWNDIINSYPVEHIVMNGRHTKKLSLIVSSSITEIRPVIRMNFNYIFINTRDYDTEKLYKQYTWNMDYDAFCHLIENCTWNGYYLVLVGASPHPPLDGAAPMD
jgi:hypothetical protein